MHHQVKDRVAVWEHRFVYCIPEPNPPGIFRPTKEWRARYLSLHPKEKESP